MVDSIFSEKRTRSQLALPDDILKMPQGSPMKDAKKASRFANKSSDDELLLSPTKRAGKSKRSVTPEPQDEYSPAFGSPSGGRELKRVKRDNLEEGKEVNDRMNWYTHRPTDSSRTSETGLLKGKSRERSSTMSKKPTSTVSASPPPSIYSPLVSPKGRAQSVPLFTMVHPPRIDFRNLPHTPMRSRSSSPTKEKLRITAGMSMQSFLPTISDEPSAMDMSDGSTSVPEERELPPIEQPIEIQPLRPGRDFPGVPATPMTDSLNKLMPLSPLTPITETPLPGLGPREADNASRYEADTGWSTNVFKEFESTESTAKTARLSMSKSRLPRLTNGHSVKSPQPEKVASATASTSIGKKKVTAAKKDAFDMLMKRPLQAKEKLERKAKLSKGAGAQKSDGKVSAARIPQPSIFAVSETGEKPAAPLSRLGMKMRERMRPKPKSKNQKHPLLIPMADDDEETMSDPGVDGKFEAANLDSRQPPDPKPSTLAGSSTHAEEEIKEKGQPMMLGNAEIPPDHHSSEPVPVELTPITTEAARIANLPTDKAVSEVNPMDELAQLEQPPSVKAGRSKLPLGKKRQPTSIAPAGRVTRSFSKQQDQEEFSATVRQKKPNASVASALKRTASGRVKKTALLADETSVMDTDPNDETHNLPPGSPMKTSSPAKTPPRINLSTTADDSQTIDLGAGKLTLAKSPTRSKSFIKPASTPSPSKIARATSMFIKPTITNVTRTFSTDFGKPAASAGSGSSLSTLSNALEKLRMPPPSRPNTSMGFNEDLPEEDEDVSKPSSKDDTALGKGILGHSAVGLKRSATLGAGVFRRADASSSKVEKNGKIFVQKPLSSFMSTKGTSAGSFIGSKLPHFGVGGPIRRTISKKSSLPMVVGSPVKGGNDTKLTDDNPAEDESGGAGSDFSAFFAPLNASTGSLTFEDLEAGQSSKGKEKAVSKASNASRRVSMVSHALSQSLSSLPQSSSQGLMGPPPTPPTPREGTCSASGQHSISSTSEKTFPQAEPSTTVVGSRSSARIATRVSQTKAQEDALNSSARKDADVVQHPTTPVPESLKILNDCVIFVDVRTDEGGDAGPLFAEMLEGVGAKVLSRVGQTCTHIVYKDGLMSTLTRYRLLRHPKPLVVGIGWVVDCVEQRKHVDETNYLVDLDGVNVSGINKRRRSILPKILADASDSSHAIENGEVKEEGEESQHPSASQDDDLAPLERARRRKSMIVGPHS